MRWKAIAARNAGAKALIVIARDANFTNDRLTKLTYDNQGGDAGLPVVVMSHQGLDKVLALANTSVSKIEPSTAKTTINEALSTVAITLSTDVVRKEVPAYNVIGVLEGSDPVLKNEYIVIGAHYDHLGRGGEGSGSLAPSLRRDPSRRRR